MGTATRHLLLDVQTMMDLTREQDFRASCARETSHVTSLAWTVEKLRKEELNHINDPIRVPGVLLEEETREGIVQYRDH
jgi:hypothetical protein